MEHEQPVRTTKKDDADEEETTKIKKPPTTKKRKSRLLRELEDHLGLPDPSSSSSDDDNNNDSDSDDNDSDSDTDNISKNQLTKKQMLLQRRRTLYKQNRDNRTQTRIIDDALKQKKLDEKKKNNRPPNFLIKKNEKKRNKTRNRSIRQIKEDAVCQKKYHTKYSFYRTSPISISTSTSTSTSISTSTTISKKRINITTDGMPLLNGSLEYINTRSDGEDETIYVYDHNEIVIGGKDHRYYTTCCIFGAENVKESIRARDQSRFFLYLMFGPIQTVTHLHHLGNPHDDGYYKKYDEKKINESSCHHLLHAYQHNSSKILVATSNIRTELIFIPNIFATKIDFTSILSTEEMKIVKGLRNACYSTKLLLAFKLNGQYTIGEACGEIGETKSLFHSCVPHLRFATHCCKNCASIHVFPNKKPKLYNKTKTDVEQYGSVKLVHSNVKTGTATEAFLCVILPLTKMLEHILQKLPEELFKNKLGSIKTLYDTACTYISLNLFWGASTDDRLPKMYYTRKRVGAKDTYRSHKIGDNHDGLYLHKDKNNWGFGAVLIFGADIDGFDQRYVTLALRLPCPGWSVVLGDYRNLLHAVSKGKNKNGLRFSLVIANHKSTVIGENEFGQTVFNEDGINTVV